MNAFILKNESGKFYCGLSPLFYGEASLTDDIQEATIVGSITDEHRRLGLSLAADLMPIPQHYALIMGRLAGKALSPLESKVLRFMLHDPFAPRKSARYTKTREQLRALAKSKGIKRGRNTGDTVANLKHAGISIT